MGHRMNDDETESVLYIEPGIDELLKSINVDEAIEDYKKMTDPYEKTT